MRTRLVAGGLALALVSFAVATVTAGTAATAKTLGKPRPTVTATTTTTATPTATTTPASTTTPTTTATSPSPTPTPAGCDGEVSWGGTAYCPAYIGQLLRNLVPVASAVVVQGVPVWGVNGQTITVNGGTTWCPPGYYCGQTLEFMDITFPEGSAVPAYGDVVDVYGRAITGGLAPNGYTAVGHCQPELDC